MKPFKVSLDNLTIVANEASGLYVNFRDLMSTEVGFEGPFSTKFPYRYAWQGVDGTFIQWTDNKRLKPVRIDFNPNKCDSEAIIRILRTLKYGELTRFDVALDFEADLSEYYIQDGNRRKQNYWLGTSGKLETKYIGTRNSDLMIRIYDKAKEQQKENENYEPDIQWWRVEAQMSGRFIDVFERFKSLYNPFTDLRLFKPDYTNLDYKDEAIVYRILNDDHTGYLGRMEKRARSKYKKIIASMKANDELNLYEIFEKEKQNLLYHIHKWLDYSKEHSVVKPIR